MHILGIDIGGTKTAVIAGTDTPEILKKYVFATESPKLSLDKAAAKAKEFLTDFPEAKAVGISCGGPLSSKEGLILSPPNLPGWDAVPVCAMVSDALGIPAFLQNDANACAWAEYLWGAGQGCKNMIFLTFGTGLGAGLVLNGALYTGANDMAGEVGHLRLAKSGPLGYGKEGSFEGFCSGGGLARLAEMRLKENPSPDFLQFLQGRPLTAKELSEAAKNGSPFALDIFKESGRFLGQGLALLLDIINPEVVAIGSMYLRMEEFFRPSMLETLQEECLPHTLRACRIVPALLGEAIGDYAALGAAIHNH